MKDEALCSFADASIGYDKVNILESINFSINEGDFIGIVGPNGSGKTTLLRSVLGLIKPRRGEISRREELNNIGYVPQRHKTNPYFPLSSFEIVLMGRYGQIGFLGRAKDIDEECALNALRQVSQIDNKDKLFSELSGGQKQRVLIARALATKSPLLLLDEPTNGMDLPSEAEIMALLTDLHQSGKTILFVSHNLTLVSRYAQTIVLLNENKLLVGDQKTLVNTSSLSRAYGYPIVVLGEEDNIHIWAKRRKEEKG